MFLKNALELLKESDIYREWSKEHRHCEVSYAFTTVTATEYADWQIGYYNPNDESISTFIVTSGNITKEHSDQIFKDPDGKVHFLDFKKVNLSEERVFEIVDEELKKKYKHEQVTKTILLLQTIDEFGTIWNVTVISTLFNAINIKIDAHDGTIKHSAISNLLTYGKK